MDSLTSLFPLRQLRGEMKIASSLEHKGRVTKAWVHLTSNLKRRLRDSNMTWKKPAASFGRRVSPVRVLSSPVTENLPTTPCHWQLAHNPPSLATCPQSPITGNLPAIPRHWQLARNPQVQLNHLPVKWRWEPLSSDFTPLSLATGCFLTPKLNSLPFQLFHFFGALLCRKATTFS